jgi:hypothetical protein
MVFVESQAWIQLIIIIAVTISLYIIWNKVRPKRIRYN